jgi:hypothetical protein
VCTGWYRYALAAAGERPVGQRGGRRDLIALVTRCISAGASGLQRVSCAETLNGYHGAMLEQSSAVGDENAAESAGGGSSDDRYAVPALLSAISKRGPR